MNRLVTILGNELLVGDLIIGITVPSLGFQSLGAGVIVESASSSHFVTNINNADMKVPINPEAEYHVVRKVEPCA